MAASIPSHIPVIVLEMNNDTNQIMGIGMVTNRIIYNKYSIYQNTKFNLYAYTGTYRVNRTDLNPSEEQMMQVLDHLCFKGKRHLKRLQGIKQFPLDLLYNCKTKCNLDVIDMIISAIKGTYSKGNLRPFSSAAGK